MEQHTFVQAKTPSRQAGSTDIVNDAVDALAPTDAFAVAATLASETAFAAFDRVMKSPFGKSSICAEIALEGGSGVSHPSSDIASQCSLRSGDMLRGRRLTSFC